MELIAATAPVPLDHYVVKEVDVPCVTPRPGMRAVTHMLDATSVDDPGPWRRVIAGPSTIYGEDGSEILCGDPALINAALSGGGRYKWISPNETFRAESEEEFLERKKREEEEERELYDGW